MIFSVLTVFPCLRTGPGEGAAGVGDSPEIEALHENIRMENRFTVKASFIIAPKEPRLVCSSFFFFFALIHVCNSIVFNPMSP